jgi:hypothetical protein
MYGSSYMLRHYIAIISEQPFAAQWSKYVPQVLNTQKLYVLSSYIIYELEWISE